MTDKTMPVRPQTPADAACYAAKSSFDENAKSNLRPFQPVYSFGKTSKATTRPEARRVRFKKRGE